MIPSLPRPGWLRAGTVVYALIFFAFLFLPLVIVAVFAFNDAPYPAPPWRGFTLDWFLGSAKAARRGLFADKALMGSLWTSAVVACWVTVLAVLVGTANAFLIERSQFRGKSALSLLMLAPLVIPGVILALCGVQSAWASPRNPLGRAVVAKGRVEGAVPWFVGGVVAVLAMEGYGIGLAPRAYQSDGPYSAESEELTRFIVEKVPRDARIAFFRPRALRLLTGRPALAIMSPDPGGRATYFVLNKRVTPDNRGLLAKYQLGAEYFEEHQSEFEVQFENEQFVLYRRLTLPP